MSAMSSTIMTAAVQTRPVCSKPLTIPLHIQSTQSISKSLLVKGHLAANCARKQLVVWEVQSCRPDVVDGR